MYHSFSSKVLHLKAQFHCEFVFVLISEIMDEMQETFYILSGSSFTRSCPGEFANLKWTFEASNATQRELELRSEMVTVTTNKTLYIGSVKNTNAGKYTCWVNRCGGPNQKQLTINLCVVTGEHLIFLQSFVLNFLLSFRFIR